MQKPCNSDRQIFSQHFNGSVLWYYSDDDMPQRPGCYRLTRLAEKKRWSPYYDINWSQGKLTDQFPSEKSADLFCGFAPYDQLPQLQRCRISWQRHSMEISEILHGEQLALLCASQLVSLMPCMESRLFASMQAADEARHVEFFRRYIESADMKIFPPSPQLKGLTLEALQSPHWEIKLLICQILIESLAMAQFSHLIDTHPVPLLTTGLRRIIEDEARHVKFGADCLELLFRDHCPEQRNCYGHYIIDKAFALAASDNYSVSIAEQYGWNIHQLRQHLRHQRIRRPELFRQRFRQLSLNLKATGLMTRSVEQRLEGFIAA